MTISTSDIRALPDTPQRAAMPRVVIEIPGLHLISEGNAREHWAAKLKRKRTHEIYVHAACNGYPNAKRIAALVPPYIVRWTRVGKKLIDPDGVGSSFKFCQDELCRILGVDDGDTVNYRPEYRQEKGKAYAVRIEIESEGASK